MITKKGKIKNCPSMKETYGHIKILSFEVILYNQHFTKLWKTTKDNIKVCSECEYRYICTDCRVFIEDLNDQNSKPLKCGYDPYLGKWEQWQNDEAKMKLFRNTIKLNV